MADKYAIILCNYPYKVNKHCFYPFSKTAATTEIYTVFIGAAIFLFFGSTKVQNYLTDWKNLYNLEPLKINSSIGNIPPQKWGGFLIPFLPNKYNYFLG